MITNDAWDNGGWWRHCWLRGRRHWWSNLGYRRWPDVTVRMCLRCGRKTLVTRA